MNAKLNRPSRIRVRQIVLDEDRVEIGTHNMVNLLSYDAGPEAVRAPDFKDPVHSGEHLGDKFVPSQYEAQPPWVFVPHLIAH